MREREREKTRDGIPKCILLIYPFWVAYGSCVVAYDDWYYSFGGRIVVILFDNSRNNAWAYGSFLLFGHAV